MGRLSPDGLSLDPNIHQALWVRDGWECIGGCVIEGPEEYYRDGWFYLFYSSGSTWDASYAVGAAVAANPMQRQFVRISTEPILRSGHIWLGPGGNSAPITGPDGNTYIFYHAATAPNPGHNSAERFLLMSPINWEGLGGYYPLINDGTAG